MIPYTLSIHFVTHQLVLLLFILFTPSLLTLHLLVFISVLPSVHSTTLPFIRLMVTSFNQSSNIQWTQLECELIDEVIRIQGSAYWHQADGLLFTLLYAFICTFGAIANLFVIFVFARSSSIRNVRNSFIVNLAASDLLLCTLTAPATLYLSINLFWPLGNVSCKIISSVQALNTFVSSLTLAMIAVDRVLLTISPMKWRLAARAPIICYLLLWLISLIVALPYSLAVHAVPVESFEPWTDPSYVHSMEVCNRGRPLICQERSQSWESPLVSKLSYTLTVLAIQYLMPLFALGFAYTQIGSTIRRRGKTSTTVDENRRMNMQQKNRKALVLLVILVATYALSWAPVNVYNVLASFQIIQFSQYKYLFCHMIAISSACINPITYALVNDAFRDAASLLLCPNSHGSSYTSHTKRTQLIRREDVDGQSTTRKEYSYIPPISQDNSLL